MAATSIAFYGIRLDVTESDLDALEARSHPAMVAAKNAGLHTYWGNFDSPGERYFLFLGRLIVKLGLEDGRELQFGADESSGIAADVCSRLEKAGYTANQQFYFQFHPDD